MDDWDGPLERVRNSVLSVQLDDDDDVIYD